MVTVPLNLIRVYYAYNKSVSSFLSYPNEARSCKLIFKTASILLHLMTSIGRGLEFYRAKKKNEPN